MANSIHFISHDQVKAMLRATPDLRHRTAMLVTYLHALRASEVCGGPDKVHNKESNTYTTVDRPGLRFEDVQDGYIVVQRLKGSQKTRQRLLASPDPLLDEVGALAQLIKDYNLKPGDRLFPFHRHTLWTACQKAGLAAGIPKALAHPHILKHSIAMHLVRKIQITELQKFLGHQSLASTGVYTQVNDEQASAAMLNVFREEGL